MFVVLDGSLPTRLCDAFPAQSPPHCCGIDEAVERVAAKVGATNL